MFECLVFNMKQKNKQQKNQTYFECNQIIVSGGIIYEYFLIHNGGVKHLETVLFQF